MEEKIVLCGANAYDRKYYFNQKFDKIPDSIKDELHIICVLFTEEVGGIITLAFEPDGTLVIETNAADDDFYYDEISSGLLRRENAGMSSEKKVRILLAEYLRFPE